MQIELWGGGGGVLVDGLAGWDISVTSCLMCTLCNVGLGPGWG